MTRPHGQISSDTPDDATVVVTAAATLPIDDAWRALTDANRLAQWYWPPRLQASYEIDAQVGGVWRVRSEVISMGFTAVFGEVVPPERLAMTWQWDEGDAISKVEIGLVATDAGTAVTVTHSANPTVAARDEHRQGWTDCLARFVEL
jgi:uncharacterized protein YndB with AHSA1/START domain